jgi:hypothetical protein
MKKLITSIFIGMCIFIGSFQSIQQVQAEEIRPTLTAQVISFFDEFFDFFEAILSSSPIFVEENDDTPVRIVEEIEQPEEKEEIITEETIEPTNGVYVMYSPTPSRTVIAGATNVIYLYLTIYNETNEDIFMKQVGFRREGVGSPRDFEDVTLFEDVRRVTSPTNVDNQSVALFRLQPRPLEVPKLSSKTFVLRGNIADNGLQINNHENYFTLIEDLIVLEGQESAEILEPIFDLPPERNVIRTIDIDRDNDLTIKAGPGIGNDEYLALGNRDTFGYFRLESDSDDAIIVQSIEFEISRHTEVFKEVYLQLTNAGEQIVCPHSTVNTRTDVISFRCEDFVIPRSQTVTVAIKGRMDLGFGIVGRGDRFEFELDEAQDLFAETVSGLGVNVINEL